MVTKRQFKEFKKIVLDKNAYEAVYLAEKIGDERLISVLEDLVIESKDPVFMNRFRRFVKGANVKRLHKAITDAGYKVYTYNKEWCFNESDYASDEEVEEFLATLN